MSDLHERLIQTTIGIDDNSAEEVKSGS
jgi:ABC-type multidrug transport system ATPase subunit